MTALTPLDLVAASVASTRAWPVAEAIARVLDAAVPDVVLDEQTKDDLRPCCDNRMHRLRRNVLVGTTLCERPAEWVVQLAACPCCGYGRGKRLLCGQHLVPFVAGGLARCDKCGAQSPSDVLSVDALR